MTNAAKLLPDQTPLAGQQIAYLYDDIGNRTSARYGGGTGTNAGPDREISYAPDGLNQYRTITHPQTANILGLSDETAGEVVVSGQIGATDQQGDRFHAEIGTTEAEGEWVEVEVAQGNDPPVSQGSRWIPGANVQRSHDDDGNLVNDGRWKYGWDAENRLTSLTPTPEAVAGGHPDHVLEFAYDHLSRRIRKLVLDRSNNNAVLSDRRFLYDGWNLIAEFEADPQNTLEPVAYHAWAYDLSGTPQGAGGVGGLYASHLKSSTGGSWENYFPTYDGNGNIIAWINDQGNVAQRLDYDAFGNVLTKQGTLPGGVRLNFGFSTKYQDQETGLLYYGFRYYDPVTGRWPSRDPIGERGGLNLYGFVYNCPSNKVDLFGFEPWEINIDFNKEGTGFKIGPTHRSTVNGQFVPNEPKPENRAKPGNTGRKQGPLPSPKPKKNPGSGKGVPTVPQPGRRVTPPVGKANQPGGTLAEFLRDLYRSPAGSAWKIAFMMGKAKEKCKELQAKRKAVCEPVCDCCEVHLVFFAFDNLGATDTVVKIDRIDYWECTSCYDVLRYRFYKKQKEKRDGPAMDRAGSNNFWEPSMKTRNEWAQRGYQSYGGTSRRIPMNEK